MRNPVAALWSRWALSEFLDHYPDFSVRPSPTGAVVLAGHLDFMAVHEEIGQISDSFHIEICVPNLFPLVPPNVRELAGRIPKTFHKLDDGSLCLGSPFRIRSVLGKAKTLKEFVEQCLVPYVAGYTYFEKTGRMPFGELDHGPKGLLDDFRKATGARSDSECIQFLHLLGLKKRIANKKPCPCKSGVRLGRCHGPALNKLRSRASRSWFRASGASLIPVALGRSR